MPRLTAIGIIVALLLAGVMPAWADTRVALIIGNSTYDNVNPLENPGRDARAIAETLKGLGFDTTLVLDQGRSGLEQALRRFTSKARGADVAAVYYAGHGMEAAGENYLIPVDATLKSDDDIDYELVPLELVMKAVSGATQLRLVMLDACRNNPFAAQMEKSNDTRSVGRGFVRVEPTTNTLVAFAAKDGTTADDGDGQHSPFAAALLKRLPDPGVEISFLFRKVRDDVLAATNRKQEPFVYGSMGGEPVYLVAAAPPPPTPAPAPEPAPIAQVDPKALDLSYWNSIQGSENPTFYESYLRRFPDGTFSELAKAKLEQLKAAEVEKQAQLTAAAAPPKPAGPEIEAFSGTYVAIRASAIRSAPEEAAKVRKKLRIDDAVEVTGRVKDGDWVRTGEGDTAGYVPLSDLAATEDGEIAAWAALKKTPALATAKEFQAQFPDSPFKDRVAAIVAQLTPPPIEVESLDATYVVKQTANVRAEPNATAKLLGKLAPDAGIAVTGKVKGKDWLRVQQGTEAGYVSASQLAPIDAGEMTDWQALQTTPTYESAQAYLQKHPSGYFKDRVAQIALKLAPPPPAPAAPEIEPLTGTYVAVQAANVRAEPNASAKALGRLSADDAVTVTGKLKDGDWLRVDREGQAAFVSAKLLQKVDENEFKAWRELSAAPKLEAADAFIAQYPNGYFAPKAQVLKASLQPEQQPAPSPALTPVAAATQSPAGAAAQPAPMTPEIVSPAPAAVNPPAGGVSSNGAITVGQIYALQATLKMKEVGFGTGSVVLRGEVEISEDAGGGRFMGRATGLSAEQVLLVRNGESLELTFEATNGPTKLWLERVKPGAFAGKGTGNYPRPNGSPARFIGPATFELVAAATPAPAEQAVPKTPTPQPAAVTPQPPQAQLSKEIRVGDVYLLQGGLNIDGSLAGNDKHQQLKETLVITAASSSGVFSGKTDAVSDVEIVQEGDSLRVNYANTAGPAKFRLTLVKAGEFSGDATVTYQNTFGPRRYSGTVTMQFLSNNVQPGN